MTTGEIKSKVDRNWDTTWSGTISDPLVGIELLKYLLFIKRLDEPHTLKENKATRLKSPITKPFSPEENKLWCARFKDSSPETMIAMGRNQMSKAESPATAHTLEHVEIFNN